MIVRLVEFTNGLNYGKFAVMKFDAEWSRLAHVDTEALRKFGVAKPERGLLATRGWSRDQVIVFDLQTCEGAAFTPGGLVSADLDKHAIWVCPLFQPFLTWLYAHPEHWADPMTIPEVVELPKDAESLRSFALAGYRRPGKGRK